MIPACILRFLAGGACPGHAAARLRCVSLGDVEAEPERALLQTVRRYNTVQDCAAHRYSAMRRHRGWPTASWTISALPTIGATT